MKALVSAAFLLALATSVAFPDETIFTDGFEAPRSCWEGGGFVGKLDLCFDVPFGITPPVTMDSVEASTEIPRADLIIGMDTTGSMIGEIANLKSTASTIIDEFLLRSKDGAVSVAAYDDYPLLPYGNESLGDRAFYLLHRSMTISTPAGKTSVISAINTLTTHNGADTPESGWEMVQQVATGLGSGGDPYGVPLFNPATAPPVSIPEGEETGEVGGVGIRDGSMPILLWISDAPSHNSTVTGNNYQAIPGVNPANSAQAIASMNNIGGRIIGVMSG